MFPKEGLTQSKFWASMTRLTLKVMGIACHGYRNAFLLTLDDIVGSTGGDLTVECIHQMLHWLEENDTVHYGGDYGPGVLHLQLDNCSVSNTQTHQLLYSLFLTG